MLTGDQLYLDLLKRTLTNTIYEDAPVHWRAGDAAFDPDARDLGLDWPTQAHTMVGRRRLDNVQFCLEQALDDGVPGDFIETGVWRGGVCIFARGLLKARGVSDRRVWVADSFQGIPETGSGSHPLDEHMALHRANGVLGVSLETVKDNFRRYDLLDDQVRFLPGWFRDTLPTAPVGQLAVLRLDGDLYESTMDGLGNLYPRLSPGGFVIIDDYFLPACRKAVHEYRDEHGIDDPITTIDLAAAFWRRSR